MLEAGKQVHLCCFAQKKLLQDFTERNNTKTDQVYPTADNDVPNIIGKYRTNIQENTIYIQRDFSSVYKVY